MIGRKKSEAAIRVGAEGAEWLAWRLNAESLVSGRMTASFSVEAALEQWLGRAERFGLRPKRVWLIAGADSCAHRRLTLGGTDRATLAQAIPFAVAEELPLPLVRMWWNYSTQPAPDGLSTFVDVVATPRSLFGEWEEVLQDHKLEIAGRVPEGPLLWRELAAIRGSELDLLAVWGERRANIIRGSELGMTGLQAFVRGPGESWESLLPDLRRPFQSVESSKAILSVFTAERLRKRILSLEDLVPSNSENFLTRDIFHGVPEEVAVAVSLLAARRLRMEKRTPDTVFTEVDRTRPAAVDIREVARSLEVPVPKVLAVAGLLALAVYLGWFSYKHNRELAGDQMLRRALLKDKQAEVGNRVSALRDAERYLADWGSVWLELSQRVPEQTLFKDLTFGVGSGFRINGNTENQESLAVLDRMLQDLEYFQKIRIQKTELADKRLNFQIFADFDASKVERYEVGDPYALGVGTESAPSKSEPAEGAKTKRKKAREKKSGATPQARASGEKGKAES